MTGSDFFPFTSFEKQLESSSGHTLTFYQNLMKYRFYNTILLKNFSPGLLRLCSLQAKEGQMRSEFRIVGLENIYSPSTHYDPLIIERTIGLLLGPSTALHRSFIEHCNLTNKVVDYIMGLVQTRP